MSFPYEQAVIDFDLDFFQQTSNKSVSPDKSKDKNDKVRTAVGLAKQKITAIDSMLRKFYENKNQLAQVERALYASKEECKQACIDTRNISEKCIQLEQEVQKLHISNNELQEKLADSQNLVSAIQSHANQLQILVNEKETLIESFNIENRLEKNIARDDKNIVKDEKNIVRDKKSLARDEKKLALCQKENSILMRHIYVMKDIVFGKRKLSKKFKAILEKYVNDSDDSDPLLGEIISDEETDIDCNLFSPPMSPAYKKRKILEMQKSTEIRKTDESHITKDDNDSDFIEVISLDTGCGSSLAFYDGEKYFNSPDYLMHDSPINTDTADVIKVNTVEAATSPIPIVKSIHVATSPLRALDFAHTATSPMSVHGTSTSTEPIFEISSPSSAVDSTISNHETEEISTSSIVPEKFATIPARVEVCETPATKLLHDKYNSVNTTVSNKTITCPIIIEEELHREKRNVHKEAINERECLELNSSDNFDKKYTRDCEVEMILNKMRFDHALITPLPATPPKSQNAASGGCASRISCVSVQDQEFVCKDAIKIREENKILTSRVINMELELKSLKGLLINKNIIDTQNTEPGDINPCKPNNSAAVLNCNTYNVCISSLSEDDNDMTSDLISIQAVTTGKTNIVTNDKDPSKAIKRLQFEESWPMSSNSRSPFIENDLRQDINEVEDLDKPSQKQTISKPVKQRKLTKLDRFRKKLLPKSKIKTVLTSPMKKSHVKSKQSTVPAKKIAAFDATKLINNKSAYEKALKVMLEMKSQQKLKKAKQTSISKAPKKRKLGLKLNNGKEITTDFQPTHESSKSEQLNVNEESLELQNDNKEENSSEITQTDMKKSYVLNEQCVVFKKTGRKKSGEYKASLCNETVDLDICKSTEKNASGSNVWPEIGTAYSTNKTKDLDTTRTTESHDTGTNIIIETNKSIRLHTSEALKTLHYTDTNISKETNESVQLDHSKKLFVKESHNTNSYISEETNEPMQLDSCDITSIKGSFNTKNITVEESMISVAKCDKTINVNIPSLTSPRMSTRKRNCVLDKINSLNQKQDLLNDKQEGDVHKQNESDVIRQCDNNMIQERFRKRASTEKQEIECKRILRSSTRRQSNIPKENSKDDINITGDDNSLNSCLMLKPNTSHDSDKAYSRLKENITYGDLDLFNEAIEDGKTATQQPTVDKRQKCHPKDSIFCTLLDKYGKHTVKNFTKNISDNIVNSICKTIESEIDNIKQLHSNDMKHGVNKFVEIVTKWEYKHFISGLMHYLKDSQRKVELFNKTNSLPAPPMTKSEQILVEVLAQLRHSWSSFDVVDCVLCNIEYVLFKLNRTPEFNTIESMGHFYAVVCRYFMMKSRLRTFMLDAMYCIQFKAVPLIKQCLEVWMLVLPLAHMGIARSPLVTCMVYLLHFYKCDDRFNRVQVIRNILRRKYFYEITEWNETQIMHMFKSAIKDVRGIPLEDKLLRMALIVLAKRQGPRWCQNVLIKNVILPMIQDDRVPEKVKVFCVSILGPLLKPYPIEMKIHCEIIHNLLTDMLKQQPSPQLEEAIFTSLIYMSRQNYARVVQVLLTWQPKVLSPGIERLLRCFVREKPLKMWKTTLSKIPLI